MPTPELTDDNDIRRQIALDPPRFRGVLHSWCVPASAVATIVAMLLAPKWAPRLLVGAYGLTLVAMFLFSALFHRIRWTDDGWWRMRQLDHTGIYLVIAGSFTGIAGLALTGSSRVILLVAVWCLAVFGIIYRWSPVVPPFGLTTVLYIVVAAMVVPFLSQLHDALGWGGTGLLLAGCGLYFVGAMALGARVPDLWPKTFGYHEVWHVVVTLAAGLHYLVVIFYAIPAAEAAQMVS